MTKLLKTTFILIAAVFGFSQSYAAEFAFAPVEGAGIIAKAAIEKMTDTLGDLTIQVFKDDAETPAQVIRVAVARLEYIPTVQVEENEGNETIAIKYKDNSNKLVLRLYEEVAGKYRLSKVTATMAKYVGVIEVTQDLKLVLKIHELDGSDMDKPMQTIQVTNNQVDPEQTTEIVVISGNQFHVSYFDVMENRTIAHIYARSKNGSKFKLVQ